VIEVVDWEMAAVLREKTPSERYQIALGMWHFARNTLRRRIAAEHPD
jgi:Rv0078B-related antitoxin